MVRNLWKDRVRGYRGDDDSVVSDPISSTLTEHRWKHITLTLAALDFGPIAMIAGLGWLLGTQRSANIMNGAARAIDCDNLEHGSDADHVHEQDLLLVADASLVTVIIGLAASLILIVIGASCGELSARPQLLGGSAGAARADGARALTRRHAGVAGSGGQ